MRDLEAHASAHEWKPLPAESSCAIPCPRPLLDAIYAAATHPAASRLLIFAPPLVEVFTRNGMPHEAREVLARLNPILGEDGIFGRRTVVEEFWGDIAFLETDLELALEHYRTWKPSGMCGNYWGPLSERRLRKIEACLRLLERWDELALHSIEAALSSPVDGLCHAEAGLEACEETGRPPGDFVEELARALTEAELKRYDPCPCPIDPWILLSWPKKILGRYTCALGSSSVHAERVRLHAEILKLTPAEIVDRLSELLDHGQAHLEEASRLLERAGTASIERWLEELNASLSWQEGEVGVLRALALTGAPCVGTWLRDRLGSEVRERERRLLGFALGEWERRARSGVEGAAHSWR